MGLLSAHDPDHIIVEGEDGGTLETAIRLVRANDTLAVTELGVISTRYPDWEQMIDRLAEKRCRLLEVATGNSTDTWDGAARMFLRATKKAGPSREERIKAAKLSPGRTIPAERYEAARADWESDSMTMAEVAAKHSISIGALRLNLGNRPNRSPGRPPKTS